MNVYEDFERCLDLPQDAFAQDLQVVAGALLRAAVLGGGPDNIFEQLIKAHALTPEYVRDVVDNERLAAETRIMALKSGQLSLRQLSHISEAASCTNVRRTAVAQWYKQKMAQGGS